MSKSMQNLQHVRMSNRKINCIRFSSRGDREKGGEKREHFQAKCDICWTLRGMKHDFICEAIFADGSGRCDILDLTMGHIIEVVCTEKEESIQRKRNDYPKCFYMIVIKAGEEITEKRLM